MAISNSTGAPAPDQPKHPFIHPGDAEETSITIDSVLAVLQQHVLGEMECASMVPNNDRTLSGVFCILGGVREAVQYLGHMTVLDNVTQIGGE